jgi:hypothetical protein
MTHAQPDVLADADSDTPQPPRWLTIGVDVRRVHDGRMTFERRSGWTPSAAVRRTAAILTIGLAGCASIPVERCALIDWRQQGHADGRAGFGPARIERHGEACAPVGVRPDLAAWEAGRTAGLLDYCQLPNAIRQGLARHAYERVCADPRFEQVYAAARRFGDARHQVEFLDGQIDWRERQLLTNQKLSAEKRAEYVAELRSLRRQRERAIADREAASRELDFTRQRLGI